MIFRIECHKGTMIKLRDYQNEAIQTIKDTFKEKNRQYVEMPTGSGKTITFLSYAKQNHKKILIIVPSKELQNQVYETALKFYFSLEISRRGNKYEEKPKSVHIAIINSIRGEHLDVLAKYPFDLVIIDEAHHSHADSYKRFLKDKTDYDPDTKILGVTATPERRDRQLLDDIFYVKSFKLTIQEMIQNKHLCDVEGYCVKTKIDISQIDQHNGDFSLTHLYKALSIELRNNLILSLCKNEMKDRKTLIFCINVKHSQEINDLLNANGIYSAHIDGSMNEKERKAILSSFREGQVNCLCNCQLLTEGFDEPSIDGIVLARPTTSRSLFIQMIGRGLRTFPNKKNCKIIDIVDNGRNMVGFNSLCTAIKKLPEIQSFNSFKEIKDHVEREIININEFKIERVNLFGSKDIDQEEATESMIDYLKLNDVEYYEPLFFSEGSFLIWMNELKKEYNGKHNKK